MLKILLLSIRQDIIRSFAEGMSSEPEVCLEFVTSEAKALGIVSAICPDLVIIDAALPDTDPLDLVRQMISINAMVNAAVISPLSDAEFHDKSEGLGVLCRLPLEPDGNDSKTLLEKLRTVLGLVNRPQNEISEGKAKEPLSGIQS